MVDNDQRLLDLGPDEDLTEAQRSLETGIAWHLEVDKVFHSSSYFKTETERIEELLKNAEFTHLKRHYYFFAHILLEILIDRFLIVDGPELLNNFYESLSKVSLDEMEDYLKRKGYPIEEGRFKTYFERFLEKKFLKGYETDEGIVHVFNSIHDRVFKEGVPAGDKQRLDDSLERMHELLYPEYKKVFKSISPDLVI